MVDQVTVANLHAAVVIKGGKRFDFIGFAQYFLIAQAVFFAPKLFLPLVRDNGNESNVFLRECVSKRKDRLGKPGIGPECHTAKKPGKPGGYLR